MNTLKNIFKYVLSAISALCMIVLASESVARAGGGPFWPNSTCVDCFPSVSGLELPSLRTPTIFADTMNGFASMDVPGGSLVLPSWARPWTSAQLSTVPDPFFHAPFYDPFTQTFSNHTSAPWNLSFTPSSFTWGYPSNVGWVRSSPFVHSAM